MFAETLVENKDDFFETFSKDAQYIRYIPGIDLFFQLSLSAHLLRLSYGFC